jgi:hypothetical protein
MPQNAAGLVSPLFSKTLISITALANNLFHKICEEQRGCEQVSLRAITADIRLAQGWDYTSLGFPLSACASWL